ncbi:DUF411 domain-containing protein [Marinimicrobium locisalis]|uniref:DUF411 domain-containing protein n=1 Tax=Marinimicrobium locisalis TaxID=546022 RepID=UPI003221EAC9
MTRPLHLSVALTLLLALGACGETAEPETTAEADPPASEPANDAEAKALTIYKSPTCGCCGDWVTHMEEAGFQASTEHPQQMRAIKMQLGIEPEYSSCHTGVSDEGYVFEGHIPAKVVQRFLENPPENALGLAVPRMPVGSPGMEMGERFEPYDVLLLKEDGSSEVYAHIDTAEEQY